MYGNLIGVGGSTALGQKLPLLSSLTELNLSGNRIDDHAVGCLVEGIANHPSLKKLCLGFNLIGDVGAEIIANQCLCSNNECLDWLNLHNNPNIGEMGTTALIQIGLASNYVLREMNIDWVRGTDQSLLEEMNMYLELNRAGRRILREENMGPFAWSCVLGGVATLSSIYYLVRLCPEMCEEGY